MKGNSPQRDFDGQISINGDGQQTKDGALRQYQDEAGQEEAPIEVQIYADAYGDGKGDGEAPDQNISHSQRHQKVVGGVFQSGVDPDGPAHQNIAGYGENSNHYFNDDVEHFHLSKCATGQDLQAVHGRETRTETLPSPKSVEKSFCCNPGIIHKCELQTQASERNQSITTSAITMTENNGHVIF